jgi:hypothetical protein
MNVQGVPVFYPVLSFYGELPGRDYNRFWLFYLLTSILLIIYNTLYRRSDDSVLGNIEKRVEIIGRRETIAEPLADAGVWLLNSTSIRRSPTRR